MNKSDIIHSLLIGKPFFICEDGIQTHNSLIEYLTQEKFIIGFSIHNKKRVTIHNNSSSLVLPTIEVIEILSKMNNVLLDMNIINEYNLMEYFLEQRRSVGTNVNV